MLSGSAFKKASTIDLSSTGRLLAGTSQSARPAPQLETGPGQEMFNHVLVQIEKHLGDLFDSVDASHRNTLQMAEGLKRKHESLEGLGEANYVLAGHTFT